MDYAGGTLPNVCKTDFILVLIEAHVDQYSNRAGRRRPQVSHDP
jgi:hypothetical protein